MIDVKKKQYVFTSFFILLICFAVVFLSLLQLSYISKEMEKEHLSYIRTFTNFYANLLQKNIGGLIDQMQLFVETVTYENLETFEDRRSFSTSTQKENLSKIIRDFFHLTDSVDLIEILYMDKREESWFLSFSAWPGAREGEIEIEQSKFALSSPKEKQYLEQWTGSKRGGNIKIHPPLTLYRESWDPPQIVIPISYSLFSENQLIARVWVYFKAESLSNNIKDFKEVSGFAIREILIVLQDGQLLSLSEERTPSINFYQENSLYRNYTNWPLFNSQEIIQREKELNSLHEQPFSMNGYLEILRIDRTQDFWGIFLQISHNSLLRLNDDFFFLISFLVLSICFIFSSFYYTASYFYTQDIRKMLEKTTLENAMQFDALTGAFTRALCQTMANKLILVEEIFALAIIDIDFFKKINDTYGHLVGDQVLINLCERIKNQFDIWSKEDPSSHFSLSRWGGEEFVILLKMDNSSLYKYKVQELQKIISTSEEGSDLPPYTVSLGVSLINYQVRRREAPEAFKFLFKEADLALYDAKQAGRNRALFYTNEEEAVGDESFLLS